MQVIESMPPSVLAEGLVTGMTPSLRALTTTTQLRAVEAAVADTAITLPVPIKPTRDLVGAEIFYILASGPSAGERRPAVIVKDWGDNKVNVQVFTDSSNDYPAGTPGSGGTLWATSVHYAPAEAKQIGTWHWRMESF